MESFEMKNHFFELLSVRACWGRSSQSVSDRRDAEYRISNETPFHVLPLQFLILDMYMMRLGEYSEVQKSASGLRSFLMQHTETFQHQ